MALAPIRRLKLIPCLYIRVRERVRVRLRVQAGVTERVGLGLGFDLYKEISAAFVHSFIPCHTAGSL